MASAGMTRQGPKWFDKIKGPMQKNNR